MAFDKNFMKKSCHFLTSSTILLCCKTLCSGNRLQENGGPLNKYQNLQKKKKKCLLSISKLKTYEIFNFLQFLGYALMPILWLQIKGT